MRLNQQLLSSGLYSPERNSALKGQTTTALAASANEALPATSGRTHSVQHQSLGPLSSRVSQAGSMWGEQPILLEDGWSTFKGTGEEMEDKLGFDFLKPRAHQSLEIRDL